MYPNQPVLRSPIQQGFYSRNLAAPGQDNRASSASLFNIASMNQYTFDSFTNDASQQPTATSLPSLHTMPPLNILRSSGPPSLDSSANSPNPYRSKFRSKNRTYQTAGTLFGSGSTVPAQNQTPGVLFGGRFTMSAQNQTPDSSLISAFAVPAENTTPASSFIGASAVPAQNPTPGPSFIGASAVSAQNPTFSSSFISAATVPAQNPTPGPSFISATAVPAPNQTPDSSFIGVSALSTQNPTFDSSFIGAAVPAENPTPGSFIGASAVSAENPTFDSSFIGASVVPAHESAVGRLFGSGSTLPAQNSSASLIGSGYMVTDQNPKIMNLKPVEKVERELLITQQQEIGIQNAGSKENRALLVKKPTQPPQKPRTKEERKLIRERARNARLKKNVEDSSLGNFDTLINEISSQGTSLCSDVSNDIHLHENLHVKPTVDIEYDVVHNVYFQQNNSLATPTVFGNLVCADQVVYKSRTEQQLADLFISNEVSVIKGEQINNNSHQLAPYVSNNNTACSESDPSILNHYIQSHVNQASNQSKMFGESETSVTESNLQHDALKESFQHGDVINQIAKPVIIFEQSANFEQVKEVSNFSEHQTSQNNAELFDDEQQSNEVCHDNHPTLQSFNSHESHHTPFYQKQEELSLHALHAYNSQKASNGAFDHQNMNQFHHAQMELNSKSGCVESNCYNPEDKKTNENQIQLQSEDNQPLSSGSNNSYGLVSSPKSSESESRLSPYQFVEGTNYPSQSSLNSNNSSPLELVQNASVVSSSYEKVSIPSSGSGDISSFEVTGTSETDLSELPTTVRSNESNLQPVLCEQQILSAQAAVMFTHAKQVGQKLLTHVHPEVNMLSSPMSTDIHSSTSLYRSSFESLKQVLDSSSKQTVDTISQPVLPIRNKPTEDNLTFHTSAVVQHAGNRDFGIASNNPTFSQQQLQSMTSCSSKFENAIFNTVVSTVCNKLPIETTSHIDTFPAQNHSTQSDVLKITNNEVQENVVSYELSSSTMLMFQPSKFSANPRNGSLMNKSPNVIMSTFPNQNNQITVSQLQQALQERTPVLSSSSSSMLQQSSLDQIQLKQPDLSIQQSLINQENLIQKSSICQEVHNQIYYAQSGLSSDLTTVTETQTILNTVAREESQNNHRLSQTENNMAFKQTRYNTLSGISQMRGQNAQVHANNAQVEVSQLNSHMQPNSQSLPQYNQLPVEQIDGQTSSHHPYNQTSGMYQQPMLNHPYQYHQQAYLTDYQQQEMWNYHEQQQNWYSAMMQQQHAYAQHYDYGYVPHNYWGYDQYSYASSAASSAYGEDSRPGSVVDLRGSNSSEQILNDIDWNSEISFQNKEELTEPEQEVHRSTPLPFTRPHIGARFSATRGVITIVSPKQPLDGEIAVVTNAVLEDLVDTSIFKRFPGPLVRGDTNRKQITSFIAETKRLLLPQMHKHQELLAQIALWEFCSLLIKQNGMFDGADVADMLLGLLPTSEEDGIESKSLSSLASLPETISKNTLEQFHVHMSTGQMKDGLSYAICNHLWGHAFMLASTLGEKCFQHVQSKYISSLDKRDPMKTLYGHLHHKDLNYIKKRANVNTWVQNLCVLISNSSSSSTEDQEHIVAFGDALREQNLVAAAHLCYLIAKVPFGTHTSPTDRIALVGLEHRNVSNKSANVWVQPLNVQLTEIYQHACSLNNATFVIPTFQMYKYEYAAQLIERGLSQQGAAYLESISQAINIDKSLKLYSSSLCDKLIKHTDMVLLAECDRFEEKENPDWVISLQTYLSSALNVDVSSLSYHPSKGIVLAPHQGSEQTATKLFDQSNSTDYVDQPDVQRTSSGNTNGLDTYAPTSGEPSVALPDDISQYTSAGSELHLEPYTPRSDVSSYGMSEETNFTGISEDVPLYAPQQNLADNNAPYLMPNINNDPYIERHQDGEKGLPFDSVYGNKYSQSEQYSQDQFNNVHFNNSESNQYEQDRYNLEDEVINQEEDLFGNFANKKKNTEKAKQDKSNKTSKKFLPAATAKPTKSWISGLISKITGSDEIHLPDDKDQQIVFDKKSGKWVDKNADPNENKTPVAAPPMTGFGDIVKKVSDTTAPMATISPMSSIQPVAAIPPMATASPFVDISQTDALIPPSRQPNASIQSIETARNNVTTTSVSKPSGQVMRRESRNLLRCAKLQEEQNKPVLPPSPFSRKAQSGTRRGNRYVSTTPNAAGSSVMPKILDPFAAQSGSPPTTFFNPGNPASSQQ